MAAAFFGGPLGFLLFRLWLSAVISIATVLLSAVTFESFRRRDWWQAAILVFLAPGWIGLPACIFVQMWGG